MAAKPWSISFGYKALFELSENRSEFVSHLFSRKFIKNVPGTESGAELLKSLEPTASNKSGHEENTKMILDILTKKHGFALSESDVKAIRYIHDSFFQFGPAINYDSGVLSSGQVATRGGSRMPTYTEVLTATDSQGASGNYLANESTYSAVRQMQMKNLIVPVTGDFAGSKSIRSIGQFLKEHEAVVTAFYTSNVEGYLFEVPRRGDAAVPAGGWNNFIANLRALPIDGSSIILRARGRNLATRPAGTLTGGFIDPLVAAPIQKLMEAVDNRQIREYSDLFK